MEKQLERNIRLYGLLKIFTKRVYLPVITIYLLSVGHLSVSQIAFLAGLSAFVSTIADVPTGYFADRVGRRASLITAGILAIIASLIYAGFPSLIGAVVAVILESLAYSFLSGSSEALMHDTLRHLNRTNDYPKVVGRSQSIGLTVNTILVALVPLTYAIDPRLPFIAGSLAFSSLLFVGFSMKEPPRSLDIQEHSLVKDFWRSIRYFITRKSVLMFLAIGILSGLLMGSTDFVNFAFKNLGLAPQHFGLVYALGSVVGVVGGFFIHRLKSMSLRTYTLLDLTICASYFVAIGTTRNLTVAIIGFGFNMGFFRLRNILYQYHLLTIFQKSEYKATLVSVLSAFGRPNEIWVPFMFVGLTAHLDFFNGFNAAAIISFCLVAPLVIVGSKLLSADPATTAKQHIQ